MHQKNVKDLNFHDSGMKWFIYPSDNGMSVDVMPNGFRKEPGLFPKYGHMGFNKNFQQFLKREVEQYVFETPYVDREKISYDFSHESLNRLFSIPRQGCDQHVIDFVNTLFLACKNHFSYGSVKMQA